MLVQHVLQSILVGLIASSGQPLSRNALMARNDYAEVLDELIVKIPLAQQRLFEFKEKVTNTSLSESDLEGLRNEFQELMDHVNYIDEYIYQKPLLPTFFIEITCLVIDLKGAGNLLKIAEEQNYPQEKLISQMQVIIDKLDLMDLEKNVPSLDGWQYYPLEKEFQRIIRDANLIQERVDNVKVPISQLEETSKHLQDLIRAINETFIERKPKVDKEMKKEVQTKLLSFLHNSEDLLDMAFNIVPTIWDEFKNKFYKFSYEYKNYERSIRYFNAELLTPFNKELGCLMINHQRLQFIIEN